MKRCSLIAAVLIFALPAFAGHALAADHAPAAGEAMADGDAKKGKKVFNKCKTCPFVDKEKKKIGPHLVGLFGRTAGSVEGFNFSDAMKNSGIVWEKETLGAYLKDPKGYIPGNKMPFSGIKKADQLQDLLAYLEEATKKPE